MKKAGQVKSGSLTVCKSAALHLVVFIVMIAIPVISVQAQSNGNPGVIPPVAAPFGGGYGQWSAAWWQWVLSVPAATSPLFDETGAFCGEGQSGKVWFLAGNFGGESVRRCRIPQGKAIFFPVATGIAGSGVYDCDPSAPGVPCDVNALRQLLGVVLDNPILLEAEVDGRPLENLSAYRALSPVFSINYPEGNVYGQPAGAYQPHVADGYWIMLAPLSAGVHTIRFKAALDIYGMFVFETETTYFITVEN